MSTLIMKFGGSAVGNVATLTQLLSIVLHESSRWDRLLMVVSALDGITDQLIEAAHLAQISNQRGYRRIVAQVRQRHLTLADKLPLSSVTRSALQADLDLLLFDMLAMCQKIADAATETDGISPESFDSIIGTGEKLATRIIAALLRENNLRGVAIDTTELIVTDDAYGRARPILDVTQQRITQNLIPMIDRGIIPVLTGYIGSTEAGNPTTLGRGGSDYTASILAVCTEADEVWVWTNVDGIMSTDPGEIPQARVIAELAYDEMAELAYFGARVLHSHMVAPLKQHNIPIYIKNILKPQANGTRIHNIAMTQSVIKAVTSIAGIGLRADGNGPVWQICKQVDRIFFEAISTHTDVMIASQSSSYSFLCFVIPTTAGPDGIHTLQSRLTDHLTAEDDGRDWSVMPVNVITAIGSELNSTQGVTHALLQQLDGLNVLAYAQGPGGASMSIVVAPDDSEAALRYIHDYVLQQGH